MNPEVPEPVGEHALDPGLALSTPRLEHSAVPPPHPTPSIPDHELLKKIGGGSYGDVWLARSKLGTYRAVKIVYRATFEDSRPFEREFKGIQKFEPISRSHEGLVDILQVGGTEEYFYYVMELADDAGKIRKPKSEIRSKPERKIRGPKPEIRKKSELRIPKKRRKANRFGIRLSELLRASAFGIRIPTCLALCVPNSSSRAV